MEVVGETVQDQMFWEIRHYTRGNGHLHGDATEPRYAGDFRRLLQVLDEDDANLQHVLSESEKKDI